MAELGDHAAEAHAAIGKLVLELGVDAVALAEPGYGLPVVDDLDAAAAWVGPMAPGEVLLVKGSRVAGLERLADRLVGP
jgi:UDP-N-acetylmuramoyl-tripeptide--D-alanyl-D-alanine ligase